MVYYSDHHLNKDTLKGKFTIYHLNRGKFVCYLNSDLNTRQFVCYWNSRFHLNCGNEFGHPVLIYSVVRFRSNGPASFQKVASSKKVCPKI